MEKWFRLPLIVSEAKLKILEKLATKFGYRDPGGAIELAIALLERASDAQDKGLEVGVADFEADMFYPWVFHGVKTVEKSDGCFGKIIKCTNCGQDFTLTEGMIYRENPNHEGMQHIDCPHCSYTNDF